MLFQRVLSLFEFQRESKQMGFKTTSRENTVEGEVRRVGIVDTHFFLGISIVCLFRVGFGFESEILQLEVKKEKENEGIRRTKERKKESKVVGGLVEKRNRKRMWLGYMILLEIKSKTLNLKSRERDW